MVLTRPHQGVLLVSYVSCMSYTRDPGQVICLSRAQIYISIEHFPSCISISSVHEGFHHGMGQGTNSKLSIDWPIDELYREERMTSFQSAYNQKRHLHLSSIQSCLPPHPYSFKRNYVFSYWTVEWGQRSLLAEWINLPDSSGSLATDHLPRPGSWRPMNTLLAVFWIKKMSSARFLPSQGAVNWIGTIVSLIVVA
jgi:hypothetical protein